MPLEVLRSLILHSHHAVFRSSLAPLPEDSPREPYKVASLPGTFKGFRLNNRVQVSEMRPLKVDKRQFRLYFIIATSPGEEGRSTHLEDAN